MRANRRWVAAGAEWDGAGRWVGWQGRGQCGAERSGDAGWDAAERGEGWRARKVGALTHDSPADYPRASDRCLDHRNVISQLRLEHTIEVLAAANSRDAVTVRERGEDADLVRGLL